MTTRPFRRYALTLGTALLVILSSSATPTTSPQEKLVGGLRGAPLIDTTLGQPPGKFREVPGAIPNQYIVVLNDFAAGPLGDGAIVDVVARALTALFGGTIGHLYQHSLLGFSVRMPEAAARLLSLDDRVAFVEQDGLMHASAVQINPPSWGLDRIDQRNLPLDQSYTYNFTGAGVKAYIIDTGILLFHSDFGGRAVNGFDAIDGGNADDCNGHGTHVAGTVGGSQYGVAKGVTLFAVRVLNCQGSGSNSQVIAGIDWATQNHVSGESAVANMSLGGSASTALDNAVRGSIADGITYALAAGNENTNACTRSPARVAEGITVGATTITDARASYSNFGTCLDIFAPGSNITSAWYTTSTATNTISGTSMASPHVAGVAALALQQTPSATPDQVRNTIVNSATPNVVTGAGTGSPNRLLYSLLTPPPPPPPPPSCGTSYTGNLSGTGDADLQPNGTYYQSFSAGQHRGNLTGPAGTDFDLALYRWNGFLWTRVAVSEGLTSTESITYNGTAGYYYFRIYSYSGSGNYSFCLARPS